ncbi:three-helix bundle dimerization domain-containing protein [Nonomuraea sp. NPDC049655]|uniref:three-helix bundle dimerization domain-containing protein n=1 Tax=Nonomuraea sp. NPDC049655 TaxID=3364355 RepID=UPI0037A7158B
MAAVPDIERFLHTSYDQFATKAAVANVLPLLAERFARQRLHASARVEGDGGGEGWPIVRKLASIRILVIVRCRIIASQALTRPAPSSVRTQPVARSSSIALDSRYGGSVRPTVHRVPSVAPKATRPFCAHANQHKYRAAAFAAITLGHGFTGPPKGVACSGRPRMIGPDSVRRPDVPPTATPTP